MTPKLRHKKLIIFDFDGTIADTMMIGWQISNKLADRFGYRHISKDEIFILRNKKTQDVLKSLQLSPLKLPFVIRSLRKELHKSINQLKPITGMKEVIVALYEQGYELAVATSNSKQNLLYFLKHHQLEKYFRHTLSGIRIFGKSKPIRKFIKKHKFNKTDIILVGDETRDIEAARNCGIEIISVSWGFNAMEILAAQNPQSIVSTPEELASLFYTSQ